MSSLNKVMLIGRLTRDPLIRHTPKGSPVTELGLAVNRSFTTESGEKREDTTFIEISLWGKAGENAAKYLSKGSLAYLEGRLRMESWTDKASGQNRTKLTVVGDTIQFLDPASSTRQSARPVEKTSPRPLTPVASHANDQEDWNNPF